MNANEPGQPPVAQHHSSTTSNLEVPKVALAIGAHPDDVEFGCGGTLAKWANLGCEIHHFVMTDGSKGTWDANADTQLLIERRRLEQIDAHERLGGAGSDYVYWLGRVDGELVADVDGRSLVARVIRTVKPEVVLSHDPWKRYRLHPDHRETGRLVCDAIVAARDPHFHPEHALEPHRPQHLLLWEADEVNHIEDVTSSFQIKLHALEAHVSQFESTMKAVDEDGLAEFRARMTTRLAEIGQPFEMQAAEAFHLMSNL
jgi:LmbE family N-acetylglucosaminyl deacetylase